jgi:type I restriction enzyme R subunit
MSKTTDRTESGFETHIVDHLVNTNGYVQRTSQDYDKVNCVDGELLFQFLEATQPKSLQKLQCYHKGLYKQKLLKPINDQIRLKGIIEVLRKGVTDGFTDTEIRLLYDKPVSA